MLDYVDVSKEIKRNKKDNRKKMVLSYIFDDHNQIPDELLQLVRVKRE